jgi:homoserine O-acetyltransferase/O-succinyltransferase
MMKPPMKLDANAFSNTPWDVEAGQLASWLEGYASGFHQCWKLHRQVQPLRVVFKQPLQLESGEVLSEFSLVMECYGTLNASKTNAILVCHALTGNAHLAGKHHPMDSKPGWWDGIVGKGQALNPDEHFIVCTHVLGGCGGSTGPDSIHPETGDPYNTRFPTITIGDMVAAQHALMQALHVQRWAGVLGGSMGGFQALEWGLRYPDAVKKLVLIASGARYSTQGIAFNAVGRHAIIHDPDWHEGQYQHNHTMPRKGLATARMLAHITYVSENSLEQKFGRKLIKRQALPDALPAEGHGAFNPEYEVESYLDYQGQQFVDRFDANSYLYLTKALDAYDVSQAWGEGCLTQALKRITAECLFVAYDTDWLFPPRETEELVYRLLRLGKRIRAITLETPHGHDAFLIETQALNALMQPFFATNSPATEGCNKTVSPSATALPQVREDIQPLLHLLNEDDATCLDLGCGEGELLEALLQQGRCSLGIEQRQEAVNHCLAKNLNVVHGDVLTVLKQLPEQSIDVAILHLALQSLEHPIPVLQEMRRVAKRSIIGFPNFGYYPIRLQLLLDGRMPNSSALPYMWYDTPNIHLFTLKDFDRLIQEMGFRQARRFYKFGETWQFREKKAWGCNFRASHAIYELV